MKRGSADVTIIPSFLKRPWDVVTLGRWAGVFVLASAFILGAWEAFGFYLDGMTPFQSRILFFWTTLVSRGSFGVIIILLAELVDNLRADDYAYDEDGESNEDSAEEA